MTCRSSCVACYTGRHADCTRCHPPARAPRKHRPGCAHCRRVRAQAAEYRLARYAAEAARDEVCIGYATEEALYGPIITFRDWLRSTAGEGSHA